MKILQIASCFYGAWKYGGGVPAIYNLSRELARRGHEVVVYATDTIDRDTRQKQKFMELEGIKVHYFRNISNRLAWHKMFFAPGMMPGLRKEMKNFDIVHLQDYRTLQNIFAHHYATQYDIPYIVEPLGPLRIFIQKKWLKSLFDVTFGCRILRDAAMLIAERSSEAKQYQAMGVSRDKIKILPLGIDLSEFDNLPGRGMFREKYGLGSKQKIVLYLGRIDRVKGAGLLVEAFAGLVKELDDVILAIAGPDTGYLSTVKRLIKDCGIEKRVLLTGPLLGKDKLEAYVDADVYVMPSWYEGFSIAPLEAYACGTPVITTDQCGTAEWMVNDFDRVVPYDKGRLKQAIIEILTEESLERDSKKQMERLKQIQERFSWASIAKITEDIYLHVLDSANH